MRNGELLRQAAATFDALITMNRGIEHQQNLRKYTIGVILISAKSNRLQDIQPAMRQRQPSPKNRLSPDRSST